MQKASTVKVGAAKKSDKVCDKCGAKGGKKCIKCDSKKKDVKKPYVQKGGCGCAGTPPQ